MTSGHNTEMAIKLIGNTAAFDLAVVDIMCHSRDFYLFISSRDRQQQQYVCFLHYYFAARIITPHCLPTPGNFQNWNLLPPREEFAIEPCCCIFFVSGHKQNMKGSWHRRRIYHLLLLWSLFGKKTIHLSTSSGFVKSQDSLDVCISVCFYSFP